MSNQDEIGSGAGDQLATDFVGGGTDNGTPESGGEEANENDEEDDDEPARRGAPAHRPGVIAPSRRRGPRRA